MRGIASQPRGIARLARALRLDSNPLRRASDRVEAWIRVGLVAIFLITGPLAAQDAGHWAYHAEITGATVQTARTHRVKAVPLQSAVATVGLANADGISQSRIQQGEQRHPDEVIRVGQPAARRGVRGRPGR
jgi:hypothetical protein